MENVSVDQDRELALLCLKGDSLAIRHFVERFEGPLLGLCLKMLGHRHEAEDTVQETLIRALRHLNRWEASRPLSPWVTMIAVNRCRTRRAQMVARRTQTSAEIERPVASTQSNTDWSEELSLGLSQLRDDYRECFILFYQQEFTILEICQMLDVPEGTVKTWLYRARRDLSAWLKARGWNPT